MKGNVYANGYQALYTTKISHIKNTVSGIGNQSLAYATVKNTTNVRFVCLVDT